MRTDTSNRTVYGGRVALSVGIGAALLALAVGEAAAQSQPVVTATTGQSQLQEVIVTATKRAEPLSKVPQSIGTLDQQQMDISGVKNFADVAALTPGVDFSTFAFSGGSQNTIAIRGISESLNTEPTAGIYIDDTPVTVRNSQNALFGNPYPLVFDLDRVEVLRGPQGTLFGAGSEAGTVRFITPEPSLTQFSTYNRAELSDTVDGTPSYELGVAAGGPIVDNELGYRVSAWARRDGGWVDRQVYGAGPLDENANWSNSAVFRGALTFAPTESFRITPSFYYQDQHSATSSQFWQELSDPSSGRFVNGDPLASPFSDRFYLPSLKMELDLSATKLESITGPSRPMRGYAGRFLYVSKI